MKVKGTTRFLLFTLLLGLKPLIAKPLNWMPHGQCELQLKKTAYSLCYSHHHRLSLWTYHYLNRELITGPTKRTNDYRQDPHVLKNPVQSFAYARTGFDRGHLVPAADMKKNRFLMSESFYMSNMTPQRPGFNRGIWRSLENLVRRLVMARGEAIIITAPVIKAEDQRLPRGITIPSSYVKIVFWPDRQEMVAFRIPNQSQSGLKPEDFQVTVNSIESETGFDFFRQLPDSIEEVLEDTLLTL